MKKILISGLFFVASILSNIQSLESSVQEEFREIKEWNFLSLYNSANRENDEDRDDLFGKPFPSKEEALKKIMEKHPPKGDGLYPHYKEEVDQVIKKNLFFLCDTVKCLPPWNRIASYVLGSDDPNEAIPQIIALVEIRKIPEFVNSFEGFLQHIKGKREREERVNAFLQKGTKASKPAKLKRLGPSDISNRLSKLHI